MAKYLFAWIIFKCLITYCEGGCTWPSPFVSSTWLDNTRGTIVFGTDTLSGWSMTITGTPISNWECLDNSSFAGDGILLVKATDTFSLVGSTWITYLCLQMTEVASNSYTYYQQAERDSKGEDERALFSNDGTITDKASICNSATVPSAEFHFMVKQGEELASIQECASPLLNKLNYEITDTSNTVACSGDASWDVCTNTSMMTFNYTLCSTQMAYSSSGEVYCMASINAGGFDYSVVYSTDSFACIVSNSDGTAATFVNNNCTVDQTPTVFAMDPDGTDIGYKTTMTTEPCFTTTTTTTTTSTTSTTSTTPASTTSGTGGTTSGTGGGGGVTTNSGASTPDESGGSILPMIIGAVVGVLLILIILALIYWFCYRKKKFCFKKKEVRHSDDNINSVTANGHVNEKPMKIEEVMDNPAITADPHRNTLTPLPPKLNLPDTTPRVLPPITNHV